LIEIQRENYKKAMEIAEKSKIIENFAYHNKDFSSKTWSQQSKNIGIPGIFKIEHRRVSNFLKIPNKKLKKKVEKEDENEAEEEQSKEEDDIEEEEKSDEEEDDENEEEEKKEEKN